MTSPYAAEPSTPTEEPLATPQGDRTRWWTRRLRLGPVAVVLSLARYPYPGLPSRWIFQPALIVDRAFGGSGLNPRTRRARAFSGGGR